MINNFNDAAACFSLGLGVLTFFLLIFYSKFKSEDGYPDFIDFLWSTIILSAMWFCLIAGLHWTIKNW